MALHSIHHLTAICGDARANVAFYTRVLGLRMVKKTVNYDDPGTYHFYYGDGAGRPGSIITFFPWQHMARGRAGAGQVTTIAFAAPGGSLGWWREHLAKAGVANLETIKRTDEEALAFDDPDGLRLEIVECGGVADGNDWPGAPIPLNARLTGFHAAALSLAGYERTARLLTDVFGYRLAGEDRNRFRFVAGSNPMAGATIDLICEPDRRRGTLGTGSVHHIALRAKDDNEQAALRGLLVAAGMDPTPMLDRTYFHSIYLREPGGVIVEVATDPPGFAVDEPADALGGKLVLPAWLEPRRAVIETILPRLEH